MAFGLTTAGFTLKRLEDIKLEVEADLRASFGEINTDSDSVFGQVIGVLSKTASDVWAQAENIYNATYPSTAEGVPLDNVASITNTKRLPATGTTVVVQMEGTEATVVPVSTIFSQSTTGELSKTVAAATITATAVHRTKITIATAVDSTLYTTTVNGTAITFTSDSSATKEEIAIGLSAAINLDVTEEPNVTSVHVSGDEFFTITSDDLALLGTFSIVVDGNQTIDQIFSPVTVLFDNGGKLAAPIGSMNTINTPVSGLTSITNLADGVLGRNLESDSEFRQRRRISLEVIAAGTLGAIQARLVQDLVDVTASFVFENREDIYTGNGTNTLVYDIDFVAGNSITFSVNGQSITPVAFTTDHDTTIEALRAAIQGLSGVTTAVLTDLLGNNRTILVTTPIFNTTVFRTNVATSVVTGGASQPVPIITIGNDGRPPHSFEAVVAALDNTAINQLIGDKIFEVKPAGIQTHGSTTVDVTDSEGEIQKIKFTHSTTKFIHVELTYDTAGADTAFPLQGETLIENEILAIGGVLTFGNDILIQVFEGAGYIGGGVFNVPLLRIAATNTAASIGPGSSEWKTVNIPINVSDLPSFDISRIVVQPL